MIVNYLSRHKKQVNLEKIQVHSEARIPYEFYRSFQFQFDQDLLPLELKNQFLKNNNIQALKSDEDEFYRVISGFNYCRLFADEITKININVIKENLTHEQISDIAWHDVLFNITSSLNHRYLLAESVSLMSKLPLEIQKKLKTKTQKTKPRTIIESLSNESRFVVRRQIKNYKQFTTPSRHAESVTKTDLDLLMDILDD